MLVKSSSRLYLFGVWMRKDTGENDTNSEMPLSQYFLSHQRIEEYSYSQSIQSVCYITLNAMCEISLDFDHDLLRKEQRKNDHRNGNIEKGRTCQWLEYVLQFNFRNKR
jgi:hypothetical protein